MYTYYSYNFDFKDINNIKIDERIYKYMEKKLTNKRLLHSLSVGKLAYEIALSNKLINPEIYYIAGILHDVGKYVNEIDTNKIMKNEFKEFCDLPSYSFHAFVGVHLIKEELKIDDPILLNAIKYHTTGKDNMDDLTLILFASDKIEPLRGFDSSKEIFLMKEDFKNGFKSVLIKDKIFQSKKDTESNRLSDLMYSFYL